jgi:hypothetical protein
VKEYQLKKLSDEYVHQQQSFWEYFLFFNAPTIKII